MNQTVTHKALSSEDAYGKPTYAAGTDYDARVTERDQKITDFNGQEIIARGEVWINGTPTIDPQDQLVLPDGSTPRIVAVRRVADDDGSWHHTKVFYS